MGISHGAEPNFNRKTLIVTDEYGGGAGVNACGGSPDDPSLPLPGPLAGSKGVGAVHFYALAGNGLVPGGAADKQGTFNIFVQPNNPDQILAEAGCTSHVFWQALDESRFVIAWYGRGTRIVDFSDPANPRQVGSFVPTSGDTWSAKPHRGFIFTGDIIRGMDVLVYTGEGGKRWPTTSGPADVQRALVQGCPTKGAAGRCPASLARTASGRLVISRRARRSSRKGTFTVRMACKQATPCRGTLRLSVKASKRRKAKRVTIARKRFAIPARRTVNFRVKLNRRGRALLRRKRNLRVEAFAKLRPAAAGANTRGLTAKTFFRLRAPRRK